MKQILLPIFACLMAISTIAQTNKVNLVVFSDDGDKFFLVINGIRQNAKSETNIRITDLTTESFSFKIIFEDANIPAISKTQYLPYGSEYTFRIKTDKKGKRAMKPFGQTELSQPSNNTGSTTIAYHTTEDVPVTNTSTTNVTGTNTNGNTSTTNVSTGVTGNGTGVSTSVNAGGNTTETTSTTTTTTTTTGVNGTNTGVGMNVNVNDNTMNNGGANVSTGVNAGGVGMNIDINVTETGANVNVGGTGMGTGMNTTTTTGNTTGGTSASGTTTTTYSSTTTTTTTSGTSGTGMNNSMNVNTNYSDNGTTNTTTGTNNTNTYTGTSNYGCNYPMGSSDFDAAKKSIDSKDFEDSKFTVAKQITKNNCLNAEQIKAVMELFDFEATRLDYAKFAYDYCYDKNNYYKLNDAFDFESSVDELNEYIEKK